MEKKISRVLILAFTFICGCGSSRETASKPTSAEEIRKHEKDFNPSTYNPPAGIIMEADKGSEAGDVGLSGKVPPSGTPELIQGYRVQIFAATSIDQASTRKDEAESLFPEEWFYLMYDPPTYKIRGGNFQTRFEADRFVRLLAEKGFRDSWIVPDRVYKSPPPKSAIPPDQPEQ